MSDLRVAAIQGEEEVEQEKEVTAQYTLKSTPLAFSRAGTGSNVASLSWDLIQGA